MKKQLGFAALWGMSFGFLGIQFGWGLQMANMSAIYEFLGAREDQIPILWLAAPMTGLLVQPLIGRLSDRTWCRLGRRRPFFLGGGIFACLALVLMPHCTAVWAAALLLWMLDLSVNVSMEPFRAFVADLLPEGQRARGFAVQSIMIGLGAVLASSLPWVMTHWFGVDSAVSANGTEIDTLREHAQAVAGAGMRSIPATVRYSFYAGAMVYIVTILWTVISTPENPPADLDAFRRNNAQSAGWRSILRELKGDLLSMPLTMRRLAWVQLFTWFGLFCMWIYFAVAVARHVFGAPSEQSPLFAEGVEWSGMCFAAYNAVCFVFSFMLLALTRKFSPRTIHFASLLCGAASLVSIFWIHDKYLLLLPMAGIGVAWASIVSMPYALLAGALPEEKTGVYMGIFNFFIVIPQIIASLGMGWMMNHVLGNNSILAVMCGGVSMLIAALLMLRVSAAQPVASRKI